MRIVAGQWRARTIAAPPGSGTRPTSDRVREALFSSLASLLGPDLGGARVLDAFAGSGALGLEALSRGAAHATFAEKDRRAAATLRANIESLGAGTIAQVLPADVLAAARRGRVPGGPFTLLFLDPPYRIDPAVIAGLLGALDDSGALEEDATAVWEHDARSAIVWPEGWTEDVRKTYGTTAVGIAHLTTEGGGS